MRGLTGVVYDPRYTRHETGSGHPERPERLLVLEGLVVEDAGLTLVAPRLADEDELALVHDAAYVERVGQTRHLSSYAFDADTPVSPDSYDTARLAAGGVLALLDEVVAGRLRTGFAFVRPPGHHAERGRAMGFCLFNNVAIGAAYLRHRHGLDRVMIVDWDVHHGNGTQHMFERDPSVLYVSTHQWPLYPGTGAADEVGRGDGEGLTVNVPLPAGCGDAEYAEAFRVLVEPIARQFAPHFILISAGFDPHARDPLGGMHMTEDGFAAMTRTLVRVANECAQGRCVAVLEGGYDLGALRDSAAAVLAELQAGRPAEEPATASSRVSPVLDVIRKVQERHWHF